MTQMENILTLLAITVAIDKRVVQEEIDTFLSAAAAMNAHLEATSAMDQPALLAWFTENKARIQTLLEKNDQVIDGAVARLIMNLQTLPDTAPLLAAMRSVAAADERFHPREKEVIALAAAYWDAPIPEMIAS